jgi:hypothetical protein
MWKEAKRNFILQQGFEEPVPAVCPRQYSALHFQPRTVFVWIVFGGDPIGAFHLTPAPAPRRSAQAIAGAFALACGLLIHFGFSTAAYVVEGIFAAAVSVLILAGFCLGSFLYHLLSGRGAFARQTLPWTQ